MAMSKTKCLILAQNDVAYYFDEKGIQKQIQFRVDLGRAIQ